MILIPKCTPKYCGNTELLSGSSSWLEGTSRELLIQQSRLKHCLKACPQKTSMKGILEMPEVVDTSTTIALQIESFFLTSHLIVFSFLQVRLMYPCSIPSGCVEQSP